MSRRVSLPGADELFRPGGDEERPAHGFRAVAEAAADDLDTDGDDDGEPGDARRSSGRVRHDEKMTVYVTADELFELEMARLSLRRQLGVAVDRGRLVREAIAIVLADLDSQGSDSQLARRLTVS